jgi:hypothetical protein
MAHSPEQIAEAIAFLEEQKAKDEAKKAAAEAREAKALADKALLDDLGVDDEFVATLVEGGDITLSSSEVSDWTGFVVGSVPFEAQGVSLKITVTVTDPDMFPEIKQALAVRKVQVEKARKARAHERKLAKARELLAASAVSA